MKIVVLVKQVPDTWGERTMDVAAGVVDRDASQGVIDEVGERALELALSYKDRDGHAEVVVLTMGPRAAAESLRKTLAMGADAAVHVVDETLSGADLVRTASVLAAAVQQTGFDVVVAGNESTDGRGGVVPAMVAEYLGIPHVTELDRAELSTDGLRGERATEDGVAVVRAGLPVVCSLTERAPEPRFPSFRGTMRAKKKPVQELSCADLVVEAPTAASVLTTVSARPPRTSGTKIVDEGNAGTELARYLAAENLI